MVVCLLFVSVRSGCHSETRRDETAVTRPNVARHLVTGILDILDFFPDSRNNEEC